MKRFGTLIAAMVLLGAVFTGCGKESRLPETKEAEQMADDSKATVQQQEQQDIKEKAPTERASAQLDYLGHASVRITTKKGTVIYIDPYYGKDYDEPANIILVTHGHNDHSQYNKIKTRAEGCRMITWNEALTDGEYQSFEIADVKIRAVPAYNQNHPKESSVGYVLEFDGIKLYHAGDTSRIEEMKELADLGLTYALLPMDNVYNMGPEEAAEAAQLIGAKYYIPIHTGPDGVYSESNVEKFNVDGKIVVKPKESIPLGE